MTKNSLWLLCNPCLVTFPRQGFYHSKNRRQRSYRTLSSTASPPLINKTTASPQLTLYLWRPCHKHQNWRSSKHPKKRHPRRNFHRQRSLRDQETADILSLLMPFSQRFRWAAFWERSSLPNSRCKNGVSAKIAFCYTASPPRGSVACGVSTSFACRNMAFLPSDCINSHSAYANAGNQRLSPRLHHILTQGVPADKKCILRRSAEKSCTAFPLHGNIAWMSSTYSIFTRHDVTNSQQKTLWR